MSSKVYVQNIVSAGAFGHPPYGSTTALQCPVSPPSASHHSKPQVTSLGYFMVCPTGRTCLEVEVLYRHGKGNSWPMARATRATAGLEEVGWQSAVKQHRDLTPCASAADRGGASARGAACRVRSSLGIALDVCLPRLRNAPLGQRWPRE